MENGTYNLMPMAIFSIRSLPPLAMGITAAGGAGLAMGDTIILHCHC